MQLRHALVVKGHLSAYQDVQDDPKTPDVYFGPGILPGLQQLGGGKVETATERFEKTSGREQIAKAKVNYLDITCFADQNVLDFEIAMHDTVAMTVVESTRDLTGELACLFLLELAVRDDVVEHLTTINVFEQHVPMVGGAHDIAHATNVWMVNEADNGRFTRCPDLLGTIGPFGLALVAMLFKRLSRHDLDGSLYLYQFHALCV